MGHWTPLTNQPDAVIQRLLLLTDGTVMAAVGERASAQWRRLTPDHSGSFVSGTWSRIAAMHGPRSSERGVHELSAVVLPDGEVLAWGGFAYIPEPVTLWWAERYSPVVNGWRDVTPRVGLIGITNGPAVVLSDGRVLLGSIEFGWPGISNTALFTPATSEWRPGAYYGSFPMGAHAWTLLRDGSVLDVSSVPFLRYVPSTNVWHAIAPPAGASGNRRHGNQVGTAILLSAGRVWVVLPSLERDGQTAFYTPARDGVPERWDAGPRLPVRPLGAYNSLCLLPSGRVLVQCSLHRTDMSPWGETASFYEFDPDAGRFAAQSAPDDIAAPLPPTFFGDTPSMLLLPDGTVLISRRNRVYVYDPEPRSAPRDEWRPRIHHIDGSTRRVVVRPDRSYAIYGELLAGWSEAHGQPFYPQATNYPLLQVEYADGEIVYWRTALLSSRAVAAVGTLQTVRFTVPVRTRLGDVQLRVITNAIASEPFDATISVSSRPLLAEEMYREDVLLIGNLADGGYVIVTPFGVQPVGPWDPALKRLHAAAKEVQALVLEACGDWQRVGQLRPGVLVTLVLAGDVTERGYWQKSDNDTVTILVGQELQVFKRADIRELYVSADGLSPVLNGMGEEALVYRDRGAALASGVPSASSGS